MHGLHLGVSAFRLANSWLTCVSLPTPFQQMVLFFQYLNLLHRKLRLDWFAQACLLFSEVHFARWYYGNCSQAQNWTWKWDSIFETQNQSLLSIDGNNVFPRILWANKWWTITLQRWRTKTELLPGDTDVNVLGRLWESGVGLKQGSYKKNMSYLYRFYLIYLVDMRTNVDRIWIRWLKYLHDSFSKII